MKNIVIRSFAALAILGAVGIGVSGCSGASNTSEGSTAGEAGSSTAAEEQGESQMQDAVIIDVRTPEEFSEGHLDGATNLDLNSGQFQEAIADLDPQEHYVLYCRSGNRSGQAAALLHDAGFENVTDLGSVQDASSETGIEIVK